MDYYIPIHEFIDSSSSAFPDIRHRAILHNSFGCHLVERVFGSYATNSDGLMYSPRTIAEEHIQDDLGFIPTLSHYLNNMTLQKWMSGTRKSSERPKPQTIKL